MKMGTFDEKMFPSSRAVLGSPGVARSTPRYMKVSTFDEKTFPSNRAVLGNIFSYKCVPFHV